MPSINKQTHYEILGVARDATTEDIKRAFRKLARQNHPDTLMHLSETAPNKVAAEGKMRQLTQAFEVLSDAEKRRNYDAKLNYRLTEGFVRFDPTTTSFRARDSSRNDREERIQEAMLKIKLALMDQEIRALFIYKLVMLLLRASWPIAFAAFCFAFALFGTMLFDGASFTEMFFATRSNPQPVSLAPALTALVFIGIGRLLRFMCKIFTSVVVTLHKGLPLKSVEELSALMTRTSAKPFVIAGLASGLGIGHLLF